jgi:hypothetical protein
MLATLDVSMRQAAEQLGIFKAPRQAKSKAW